LSKSVRNLKTRFASTAALSRPTMRPSAPDIARSASKLGRLGSATNLPRVQRRFRKLQLVLGRAENRGVANIKVLQADMAVLKKSVQQAAAAQDSQSHAQEQHNQAVLRALHTIQLKLQGE